jgi:hypothetical protein
LETLSDCFPNLVRPDGEAAFWPIDLTHLLSQLAELTSGNHATVKSELSQVCRIRLEKYPESDPDLIAQDVETVLRRHLFRNSERAGKMTAREYQKAEPRLGISHCHRACKRGNVLSTWVTM